MVVVIGRRSVERKRVVWLYLEVCDGCFSLCCKFQMIGLKEEG